LIPAKFRRIDIREKRSERPFHGAVRLDTPAEFAVANDLSLSKSMAEASSPTPNSGRAPFWWLSDNHVSRRGADVDNKYAISRMAFALKLVKSNGFVSTQLRLSVVAARSKSLL
jgi:hypothetical protein